MKWLIVWNTLLTGVLFGVLFEFVAVRSSLSLESEALSSFRESNQATHKLLYNNVYASFDKTEALADCLNKLQIFTDKFWSSFPKNKVLKFQDCSITYTENEKVPVEKKIYLLK